MISLGVIFCRVGGSGGILTVGGVPWWKVQGLMNCIMMCVSAFLSEKWIKVSKHGA